MTAIRRPAILLATGLALAAAPALAEKPEWAGQGKGRGHEKKAEEKKGYFTDAHRHAVEDYYHEEYRGGHCPPGLAKKHNGCMPPGQAKKQWNVGQPLPPGIVVYDVPQQLVVKLGVPPAGQKYVRVAADILLVAAGTNMVIDAVKDLGRR